WRRRAAICEMRAECAGSLATFVSSYGSSRLHHLELVDADLIEVGLLRGPHERRVLHSRRLVGVKASRRSDGSPAHRLTETDDRIVPARPPRTPHSGQRSREPG